MDLLPVRLPYEGGGDGQSSQSPLTIRSCFFLFFLPTLFDGQRLACVPPLSIYTRILSSSYSYLSDCLGSRPLLPPQPRQEPLIAFLFFFRPPRQRLHWDFPAEARLICFFPREGSPAPGRKISIVLSRNFPIP